jgi:cytochrome c oxidase subunit IV
MSDMQRQKSDSGTGDQAGGTSERKHPNYVGVFVLLAVLTIVEILVTYTPLPRLPVLLPLAFLKVALVVLFYMHLRFDNRIFSALFLMGLLMGAILIVSLTLMFGPPLFGLKQ